MKRRPWLKSTGPQTEKGKMTSAKNRKRYRFHPIASFQTPCSAREAETIHRGLLAFVLELQREVWPARVKLKFEKRLTADIGSCSGTLEVSCPKLAAELRERVEAKIMTLVPSAAIRQRHREVASVRTAIAQGRLQRLLGRL